MAMANFDFVVVGGGTAGLAIASRLSESPDVEILVLESGKNHSEDPRISTPGLWITLFGDPEIDWSFDLDSQEHLSGRTLIHPQGRALGGSSSINALAVMAPSKAGIDDWSCYGNPSWNWEQFQPYLERFYNLSLPSGTLVDFLNLDYIDESYRGTEGPIKASFPEEKNALSRAWLDSFESLGYSLSDDPFSGNSVGGFTNPLSISPEDRTRSSSMRYLEEAERRSNLHVVTEANVERILFNEEAGARTAVGVQYRKDNIQQTVNASKEIIVSAGVFNSPKLLQLSGIGDATLLESLGIPGIVNNPYVGKNLQDHLMTAVSFQLPDKLPQGVQTIDGLRIGDQEALRSATETYTRNRTGPLSTGDVSSYSYMPLVTPFRNEQDLANFTSLLNHGVKISSQNNFHPALELQYKFIRDVLLDPNEPSASFYMTPTQGSWDNNALPGNWMTIGVANLHPFSRGSVEITSIDPAIAPRIQHNFLENDLDLEVHARHLQYIEDIAGAPPFTQLLNPNGRRNNDYAYVKDLDAAKVYLRNTAISNWHSVGTCAMMSRELGGVVNDQLQVYGVNNLRIVDASIMPTVPRANTQVTTYGIAEKASDMIKTHWGI